MPKTTAPAKSYRRYERDVIGFFDRELRLNELGRPWSLAPHQREIFRVAFQFDSAGLLPWDTLVYACPKKSGKTSLGAAIGTWWGYCHEAPNELFVLANDPSHRGLLERVDVVP